MRSVLPLPVECAVIESRDVKSTNRLKLRDCVRCERPRSVCLCLSLPPALLQLAGRVIILQHPHEHKKRLATVPVLSKCVAGVEVVRGRVYRPSNPSHAALGAALEGAAQGRYPLLVLFPGSGARDVREVGAELRAGRCSDGAEIDSGGAGSGNGVGATHQAPAHQLPAQQAPAHQAPAQQQAEQQLAERPPAQHDPLYVLFVIDGTWQQAKEMFKAVLPYVLPPGGPGVRVQLPPPPAAATACDQQAQQAQQQHPPDEAQQVQQQQRAIEAQQAQQQQPAAETQQAQQVQQQANEQQEQQVEQQKDASEDGDAGRPVLLRVEPMEGCLTTCEAVARALGALEPAGEAVRDAILRPLAQLAHFQAQWDPAVAHRLRQGVGYSQARRRMGMGCQGQLDAIP